MATPSALLTWGTVWFRNEQHLIKIYLIRRWDICPNFGQGGTQVSPYGEQHGRVVRTLSRDRDALQHLGMHCCVLWCIAKHFQMHCQTHPKAVQGLTLLISSQRPIQEQHLALVLCQQVLNLEIVQNHSQKPTHWLWEKNLECFICIGHSITKQYLRLTAFECCI